MPQREKEASLELKAQDVNMATGMNEFNAGHYAKAAESFKKILMASVFYPESRFRLGQCQLALKDYLQAVNTFKSIGRKSPFYFQAQWELSQIYLSQGDKEKAKKILLQISKEKNPYQNQAVQNWWKYTKEKSLLTKYQKGFFILGLFSFARSCTSVPCNACTYPTHIVRNTQIACTWHKIYCAANVIGVSSQVLLSPMMLLV